MHQMEISELTVQVSTSVLRIRAAFLLVLLLLLLALFICQS